MKKNKWMIGLSVTAAMMLGSSLTALASQEGWVADGNDWYYADRDGDYIENEWRLNDAKTQRFYLGDDGRMVTTDFVEDDGDLYYVNQDGVQSRNRWRFLQHEDDDEARWYYFGSNGKAYEDGWKTIGGERYHFTNYRMDYGFLDADGQMIDADTEDAWKDAVYYMGTNAEGWRKNSTWLYLTDFDDAGYEEYDGLWLWFGTNGKKEVSDSEIINGNRYVFDENGVMIVDWYGSATPSNAEYKFYEEDDGMMRGRWFQAVPSEDQDADDYEEGTLRWFYSKSNGETYKDTIRSINGEKYIFDENGIMRTGLIVVDPSDKSIVEILGDIENGEYPSSDEIRDAESRGTLMYFNEDGDLLTGKSITLELEDGTFTLKFDKSGKALDDVVSNYLYDNGILIKADRDETGYKYEKVVLEGKEYLVNTSGKVMKAGTYKHDDLKWTVTGNLDDGFTVVAADND